MLGYALRANPTYALRPVGQRQGEPVDVVLAALARVEVLRRAVAGPCQDSRIRESS